MCFNPAPPKKLLGLKDLSKSSCQRAPVRELLSESSCQSAPVKELLSECFCQRAPVRELLSECSCQRAPVRELLSESFCQRASVRELLSESFCQRAPVRELLSEGYNTNTVVSLASRWAVSMRRRMDGSSLGVGSHYTVPGVQEDVRSTRGYSG